MSSNPIEYGYFPRPEQHDRSRLMKVSTKGDYATRALQDLALHYEEGPIQIETIARRQGLPARYLEQLLLNLKRAGFLASKRGGNGGDYLAKAPPQNSPAP